MFVVTVAVSFIKLLLACGLPSIGLNFCPSTPPTLFVESERTANLVKTVWELQIEAARRALACASVSTPALLPLELPTEVGPLRPQQIALLKLDAERWNTKDLSLLKGCWVIGEDRISWFGVIGDPRRETNCTTKATRWCFDANGLGQGESTSVCPIAGTHYCKYPITAQFDDLGVFKVENPKALCAKGVQVEYGSSSCRRIDDYRAMCTNTSRSINDPPSWSSRPLLYL